MLQRVVGLSIVAILGGCASTSVGTAQTGCPLLGSLLEADARLLDFRLSHDETGCLAAGFAPNARVAAMQLRALDLQAANACGVSTIQTGPTREARGDLVGTAFAVRLVPAHRPPKCNTAGALGEVHIDATSRNMNPPTYPRAAMMAGATGTTMLLVLVGGDGKAAATLVRASSGNELLDQAAVDGVGRWHFQVTPDLSDRPIAGYAVVPVTFDLR